MRLVLNKNDLNHQLARGNSTKTDVSAIENGDGIVDKDDIIAKKTLNNLEIPRYVCGTIVYNLETPCVER